VLIRKKAICFEGERVLMLTFKEILREKDEGTESIDRLGGNRGGSIVYPDQ